MRREGGISENTHNILFHNTIPVPRYRYTDAVYSEIMALSRAMNGNIINVYALSSYKPWMIKQFMGIAKIKELRSLDKKVDLHHVFFPFFYDFPYFRLLKKPIVFTSTSSLMVPIKAYPDRNITYVSSSTRVVQQMSASGVSAIYHVPSGIDTDSWHTEDPLPAEQPFTLLMASAPHNRDQFQSKGIYVILDYLKAHRDIRLVLIWRGVEADYMKQLLSDSGLEDQVRFINEKVDIQKYYRQSHATILLCDKEGVLKNYPHSLMESICSGRPVIMSNLTELATEVKKNKLGVISEANSIEALHRSIMEIRANYQQYQNRCSLFDTSIFDQREYVEKLRSIYQESLSRLKNE